MAVGRVARFQSAYHMLGSLLRDTPRDYLYMAYTKGTCALPGPEARGMSTLGQGQATSKGPREDPSCFSMSVAQTAWLREWGHGSPFLCVCF